MMIGAPKPLAASSGTPSGRPSTPAPDSVRQKHRVLVVDDDDDTARLLARFLSSHFEVSVASDGVEGLSAAGRDPPPEVIVADVDMPRMSGLRMAAELKRHPRTAHIPIIFLSAKDQARDVIAGIAVGARNYLTKPVSVEELEARIRRAIVERHYSVPPREPAP